MSLQVSGELKVVPDVSGETVAFDAAALSWEWETPSKYSDSYLANSIISDHARTLGTSYGEDWSIEWQIGRSDERIQPLVGFATTGCFLSGANIVFRKDA